MKKALVVALSLAAMTAFTAGAAFSECSQDKKCCSSKGSCGSSKEAAATKDPTAQDVVIDPVCGMDVKVADSKYSSKYKDKSYYFCSSSCKKSFDKNPSKYIGTKTK